MTLLLQPYFVDMHSEPSDAASSEGASENNHGPRPTHDTPLSKFPTEASEDSLYSMWKVATKVKAVMVDGARFENLTWRAWHRKNQLELIARERRGSEKKLSLEASPQSVRMSASEKLTLGAGLPMTPAQATAIPKPGSYVRPTACNQGYSSILAEIQEAGARKNSGENGRRTAASPLGSSGSKGPGSNTTVPTSSIKCSTIGQAYPAEPHLAHSGGSVSSRDFAKSPLHIQTTTNRRRKKNVDRFIKRHLNQSQNSLDVIAENLDEIRISPSLAVEAGGRSNSTTSFSTSDANSASMSSQATNENFNITVGDSLDFIEEREELMTSNVGEEAVWRKSVVRSPSPILARSSESDMSIKTHASSQNSGERSNISLLTLLLNRNSGEIRKSHTSHNYLPFTASPPSRPGAPTPPMTDTSEGGGTAAISKSPVIPSRLAESCLSPSSPSTSSASQAATDSSFDHLSEGQSVVGSTTSQGPRRRAVLPPPEFTAPLYIW